jgi:hypothetical protein
MQDHTFSAKKNKRKRYAERNGLEQPEKNRRQIKTAARGAGLFG